MFVNLSTDHRTRRTSTLSNVAKLLRNKTDTQVHKLQAMTHYETILTLRKMTTNDKFRDLVTAGSMLNAILVCTAVRR